MTSIAAYPKQFLPWLQGVFAPKQPAVAALWKQGIAYQHAITALSAKLASVDGVPNASERAAFSALFPAGLIHEDRLRDLFEKQTHDHSPVLQYARQLRVLGNEQAQRMALFEQLVQLAHCDAPLNMRELEMLQGISKVWGFTSQQFRASIARVLKTKSSSPYDVLGVSRRASDAVVRARYMEQVRVWHPDQFAGAEVSADAVSIMGEQLADVTVAYQRITRERGGKASVAARRGTE